MARIAGRSNWIAWPVGLACAAIVVALAWLAVPMVPGAVQWAGDALRGPTSGPFARDETPESVNGGDGSACRSMYTSALWSELSARVGGEPVQDASLPPLSAVSVVAALAPTVRATCTWTAASAGTIVTTVADVPADAAPIAQAALGSQGFACRSVDGGVTCARTDGAVTEDVTVRDGVWLSSRLDAWHPHLYTDRIASRLWPG